MDQPTLEYRFDLVDSEKWLAYLRDFGYAVIANVASPEEVETARNLYLELFEQRAGINRNDLSSWERWNTDSRGISLDVYTMQGKGAWFVRGLPNIKTIFSKIWNDEDLIVSMDSLILWKPWWAKSKWLPRTEGLHIDQNVWSKPHLDCVQGMFPMYDVTEEIGGLEVIPESHSQKALDEFKKNYAHCNTYDDFVPFPRTHPMQGKGKLLTCKAGDFIIWDSRTVHGGRVGTHPATNNPEVPARLARLTQTVCMTQRNRATEDVLETRSEGFKTGVGFNHCPHAPHITSRCNPSNYVPIELTEAQQALL